uniref:C-type mannose receptor 2-like n=1 Tax=Oryzias melastigma TaxID=30732 RepID=A0A3B3CF42_ORYME
MKLSLFLIILVGELLPSDYLILFKAANVSFRRKIFTFDLLVFLSGPCCFMTNQLFQYCFINEAKSWDEAQEYCREKHSDLATKCAPNNSERICKTCMAGAGFYNSYCLFASTERNSSHLNVVETELLFPSVSNNDLIFIGLFRDAWQWSDGSRSSFRFWNLNYDDEKSVNSCVMLNEKGRWNSENCEETHAFFFLIFPTKYMPFTKIHLLNMYEQY